MEVPVRDTGSSVQPGVRAVAAALAALALASCTSVSSLNSRAGLDTPEVRFNSGRVVLVLTDEDGMPMTKTRVDFSWESPEYYKTSAFTDNTGRVTFSGVPEVAEVSIDHPGGLYERTLIVPQRGIAEMRVMLETYGGNRAIRAQQEAPPTPQK